MIEIPKFHETFIPILKVLENGETLNTRELYQLVIEKFYSNLSKDQLEQKTKSGDTL
ncbi:MAG: winged helix-turn-helix domain-containing protein, partial [Fluviicola sp.]